LLATNKDKPLNEIIVSAATNETDRIAKYPVIELRKVTHSDLDDLQKAISRAEETVAATPHYHPDRADRLRNLAGSYQRMFERTGDSDAFQKAFRRCEEAVAATTEIAWRTTRHASASTRTPPTTTLCRYDSGKLVKKYKLLSKTDYVAISHVWEKAAWQDIPGIDGQVLASKEKAKFIEKRLPSIVGTKWFWMDVLCVDQGNKEARIAVTQHIPTIFRYAQKTIVVRNSTGFRDCCSQALGNVFTIKEIQATLLTHLEMHLEMQRSGEREGLKEAIFERLWVLQEVALSNCIRFVRCEGVSEDSQDVDSSEHDSTVDNFLLTMNEGFSFAWGWDDYDRENPSKGLEFLRAFLQYGTVSRSPPERSLPFPTPAHLLRYITNTRRTSKPRDFILAIMPQYDFYKIPRAARDMTFGQLLVDCFQQGKKAGWFLQPLLSLDGPKIDSTFSATDNVPEPLFLADVVKLFLGPFTIPTCTRKRWIEAVEVQRTIDTSDPEEMIQILFQCTRYSSHSFDFAKAEETRLREILGEDWGSSQYGYSTDREVSKFRSEGFDEACIILNYMRKYTPDSLPKESRGSLLKDPRLLMCAIRMAAVISCGLGASAYEWSQGNQTPVLVKFHRQSILALVSNSVASPENDPKFFLLSADALDDKYALISYNRIRNGESFYSRGLFPLISEGSLGVVG
jgi:hypothetical protein